MKATELINIKKDYESRMFTNVQLGTKYRISEGYVRKLAKENKWEKQEEEIIIVKDCGYDPGLKKNDRLANMTIDIAERMCDELHHITCNLGQIKDWIMDAEMSDVRRRLFMQILSLPDRTAALKNLSNIIVQTRGVILSEGAKGEGKKEMAQARADAVTRTSKFAPSAAPLKSVK